MPFRFIMGDITKYEGDAIVNSLGPNGRIYGQLCQSIITAANNKEIKNFVDSIENAEATTVYVTDAGELPSKHIIHVVTPYKKNDPDNKLLFTCYQKVIQTAIQNGYQSLCLPIIGSKASGYSQEDAYFAMMFACREIDELEEKTDKAIIDITGLTYLSKFSYISREMYYQSNKKCFQTMDFEKVSDGDSNESFFEEFLLEEPRGVVEMPRMSLGEPKPKKPKHILYKMCKAFSKVSEEDSVALHFSKFINDNGWDPAYPFYFFEYLCQRRGTDASTVLCFPYCDNDTRKNFKKIQRLQNKDIVLMSVLANLSKTELLEFMTYNGTSFSPRSMLDRCFVRILNNWHDYDYSDIIDEIKNIVGIGMDFHKLTAIEEELDCAWLTLTAREQLKKEYKANPFN